MEAIVCARWVAEERRRHERRSAGDAARRCHAAGTPIPPRCGRSSRRARRACATRTGSRVRSASLYPLARGQQCGVRRCAGRLDDRASPRSGARKAAAVISAPISRTPPAIGGIHRPLTRAEALAAARDIVRSRPLSQECPLMTTLNPLLPLLYEPIVQTALREDLGRAGDITADAIVPASQQARLVMRARQPGVIAGPRRRAHRVPDGFASDRAARRAARRQRGRARPKSSRSSTVRPAACSPRSAPRSTSSAT